MRIILTLLVLSVLACLLPCKAAGRASAPLPITESRNAAAGFVLTQFLVVKKVVRSCRTLPEPFPTDSSSAFSSWMGRNTVLVKASQNWLLYVGTLMAAEKGRPEASEFLTTVAGNFESKADESLKSIFPGGKPDAMACTKWLAILSGPNFDISSSSEFSADLKDMVVFSRTLETGPAKP